MALEVISVSLPDAARGTLSVICGNARALLSPAVDNCVLTTSANTTNGTGLAWTNSPTVQYLTVNQNATVAQDLTCNALIVTAGICCNGITTPPAQAAKPTTLANVITILTNLGFCSAT